MGEPKTRRKRILSGLLIVFAAVIIGVAVAAIATGGKFANVLGYPFWVLVAVISIVVLVVGHVFAAVIALVFLND